MKLLLASKNIGKINEVKELFKNLEIEIISLNDLNDDFDVLEDGNSYEENAFKKASYYYQKYQIPCISDDSGLSVDILNGLPGIYSARFSGEDSNSHKNNLKLLHQMKDKTNRNAKFICVICFIDINGQVHYFKGELTGQINEVLKGENGFGYDPLFYLPEYNKTLAELDFNQKNKISHRQQAIKQLVLFLKERL